MHQIKSILKYGFILQIVEEDREPAKINQQPNVQTFEAKFKLNEN